jgi:hypothetical protein
MFYLLAYVYLLLNCSKSSSTLQLYITNQGGLCYLAVYQFQEFKDQWSSNSKLSSFCVAVNCWSRWRHVHDRSQHTSRREREHKEETCSFFITSIRPDNSLATSAAQTKIWQNFAIDRQRLSMLARLNELKHKTRMIRWDADISWVQSYNLSFCAWFRVQ